MEVKKIVTGLGNWLNFSGPSRERPRQGESYPDKIISLANYFPFGMDQPGRSWNAGSKYRYGLMVKRKTAMGSGEVPVMITDSESIIREWVSS